MASKLLYAVTMVLPVFSAPIVTNMSGNEIVWGKCNPEFEWFSSPDIQCGTLAVPIDWSAPGNSTVNLGMARLPRPANSTAKRIGHLFVNPGGPGGSASQLVAFIASEVSVSPDILNSFDIIGVDPRGVGLSAPVQCDPAIWNERVSLFPKTREDYDHLVETNKRKAESCLKKTGEIFNHLDTISAAKDHESVRSALGEDMNWLGFSYGTQLGYQYAQLFPENIRVMVLDGVLQHSQAESSDLLIESMGYEEALKEFFAWASTDDDSILKGQDMQKLWYSILKNASETPIPAKGCESPSFNCRPDVTEEEIRFNVQPLLDSPTSSSRGVLSTALHELSLGNGLNMSTALAQTTRGNESISNIFLDSTDYAAIAISCQDWSSQASSFEDLQARMRIGETFAHLTRGACGMWSIQASCVGWPTPLSDPPTKLRVKTKDPILLVNALRDPSTGYTWAVGMLEEIENHVLLTRNGEGHTSWLLGGATTDAMNRFLLTKDLPAPATVLDS